jgi:hypothetical protein
MSSVVISGGIEILQAVQPVLQGMVINPVLIQIIADGIGITVHIDILIFRKIHRHIGRLQLRVPLRKTDTAIQIARKAQSLNMIDAPLYKKAVDEFETAVKQITEAVVLPRQLRR